MWEILRKLEIINKQFKVKFIGNLQKNKTTYLKTLYNIIIDIVGDNPGEQKEIFKKNLKRDND